MTTSSLEDIESDELQELNTLSLFAFCADNALALSYRGRPTAGGTFSLLGTRNAKRFFESPVWLNHWDLASSRRIKRSRNANLKQLEMKFTLPFATVLAALGSAQAYGLNSPTEGQVLSNSQPFTFDYSSSYFFKETTYSVTVVLAQADAWANKNNFNWGVDLGELFPKGS
ncbi:hypothetical protein VNI00_002787 [Paramarasmius palmivorus]|uniref:Uncharacterized protein n=1 Tax=Paramarasmius palmivorus TaxID=297713 RepID=A0AAW0DX76_9AGAR